MEKLNPVKRQFPCHKFAREHLHKCNNILKLKLFPQKEDVVFFVEEIERRKRQ